MTTPPPSSFFDRPTLVVAEELLGKFLVREKDGKEMALMITEVEAYDGPEDKASHAHRGRTPRNNVMFGPAGFWYVYFIYGMYFMLNIVTGPAEYPAAILIRGAGLYNGPGKLTKALEINKTFHEKTACRKSGLWIEDRNGNISVPIQRSPRIGVQYAGEIWSQKPYRFFVDQK